MKSANRKRIRWIALGTFAVIALCVIGYILYDRGRPAPVPTKLILFDGAVTYNRRVYYLPRLVIAHVLTVDTKAKGFRMLVTPPDNEEGPPLNARTTSQFLEEFDMQIAINGDGFYAWIIIQKWATRSRQTDMQLPGERSIPKALAWSRFCTSLVAAD